MGVDFSAQYLLRQLGLILAVGLLYLLLFSQYRYGVADNGD
jgi:hypothetical protein